MPLFVIQWKDKAGALDIRMAARPAHLDYIAAHPGVVRLAGPFLDEDGAMAGSLMIVEAANIEAAQAFHAGDPYRAAGLFDASTVQPWKATVGTLP